MVGLTGMGSWVLALLLVVVPWLVILVDALVLGFNFLLGLTMLLVFSVGLLLLASTVTEA